MFIEKKIESRLFRTVKRGDFNTNYGNSEHLHKILRSAMLLNLQSCNTGISESLKGSKTDEDEVPARSIA